MDPLSEDILTFWFDGMDLRADGERREIWFRSTPDFDGHLIEHFTGVHERAAAGELDHLMATAEDCLALVIALDQFPRNIFRGTPRAFDADAKARDIARHAVAQGYDKGFGQWPKVFFYLPFEHSEILADQEQGLTLLGAIDEEGVQLAIIGHHDAIKRFGRFPHRNAVLGRDNTPEEEEYLKEPPLWGKTAAEVAALEK